MFHNALAPTSIFLTFFFEESGGGSAPTVFIKNKERNKVQLQEGSRNKK
jgi:hypothetical protein